MTQQRTPRLSAYTIDDFRPSDREGFLSLYSTVFGVERTDDWFRWKYERNPYVDHVPITIARNRDTGEVVGCRSYFPLEVCIDGDSRLAFQPCDTMVHPGHRRRGLFTAMNRWGLERYESEVDGPAFFFNFPNAKSKPGNEHLGWKPIGTVPMYYRPQNPVGVLSRWAQAATIRHGFTDHSTGAPGDAAAVESVMNPADTLESVEHTLTNAIQLGHRLCDRAVTRHLPTTIRIDRYDAPPIGHLERLARGSAVTGVAVSRRAPFYRWRLDNPAREYVTFLAARRDSGRPLAALIVSPVDDHVRIVDSFPRTVDPSVSTDGDDALAPLESLLETVLETYQDRAFVTAFGDVLPRPLRYRFVPDTQSPLASIIKPTARTLYARGVGDFETATLRSRSVEDWHLSRLDLDTA